MSTPPATLPYRQLISVQKQPLKDPLPLRNNAAVFVMLILGGLAHIGGVIAAIIGHQIDPDATMTSMDGTLASNLMSGGMFAMLFGTSMVIAAFVTYLCGLIAAGQMRDLRNGKYFAKWVCTEARKWVCTEARWNAYVEGQEKAGDRYPVNGLSYGIVVGLMAGFTSAVILPLESTTNVVAVTVFGVLISVSLMGYAIGWICRFASRSSLAKRKNRPEPAVIGVSGLYFDRSYREYNGFGGEGLKRLTLKRTNGLIQMVFKFKVKTRSLYMMVEQIVPVPEDKLEEAKAITRLLGNRIRNQ
ncbi:MAG: hypothetical protein AAF456_22510 [Planctomycetota bacterium]